MGKFGDNIKRLWLPVLIWAAVVTYVIWAASISRKAYSETMVERMVVKIMDSTASRRLVTEGMVREWVKRGSIPVIGKAVDDVDLQGIERMIAENGFVGKVTAYTAADGVLRIEVWQRTPQLRLLVSGYNRYVTTDGFVFGTPASSAIYVPVVTGNFRPQFPPSFEGDSRSWCDSLIEGSNGIVERIGRLREEKRRIALQNDAIDERIADIRGSRHKEAGDRERIARKQDSIARNRKAIAGIDKRIGEERNNIKKTREEYEDFLKLLNFVGELEDDDFWQSEIVQIEVNRLPSGALDVWLIPRSGSFVIEFGDLSAAGDKLEKILKFYRDGLNNRGWDEYSVVSVAYKGQVVCKRR